MTKKNIEISGVIFLIMVFYFLLPTNNSTGDAYNYAAEIKYNHRLFYPHHLLYNAFYSVLLRPFSYFFDSINVLWACKMLNSFFVMMNLFLVAKILTLLQIKTKELLFLLLFVGFSYNFMRFGTENEVYIVPITFSLFGSFFYLKHLVKGKNLSIFLSGFCCSVACLFHQIHFFWWFGILVGLLLYFFEIKRILLYISSAFLVPLVYILVIYLIEKQSITLNNFLHFVFHDYYVGIAKTDFGFINFLMLAIAFVRSFIQIHHNILFLLKKSFLFFIPILALLYFLGNFFLLMIKKKKILTKRVTVNATFFKTHSIILILHVLFSLHAAGNVEFLVMLPIFIVFTFFYYFKWNPKLFAPLIIFLSVWNFFYGIGANSIHRFTNEEKFVDFIVKDPKAFYVVEGSYAGSIHFYKTGIEYPKNILRIDETEKIKSLAKEKLYTNVLEKPVIFDRGSIFFSNLKSKNTILKRKKHISSYPSLYGEVNIDEVQVIQEKE